MPSYRLPTPSTLMYHVGILPKEATSEVKNVVCYHSGNYSCRATHPLCDIILRAESHRQDERVLDVNTFRDNNQFFPAMNYVLTKIQALYGDHNETSSF